MEWKHGKQIDVWDSLKLAEYAAYIEEIAYMLESRGKDTIYFRCHDLYGEKTASQMAARALNRHLRLTGGRLGEYQIKQHGDRKWKHGIMWKATKVKTQTQGTIAVRTNLVAGV